MNSRFTTLLDDLEGRPSEPTAQLVIVIARWALVLVGLVLALNDPGDVVELQFTIVALFALAVVNFFVHANILMGKPTQREYLYAATVGDLTAITTILALTDGGSAWVFYFPALLAYGLALPRRAAVAALLAAGTAFTAVAFSTSLVMDEYHLVTIMMLVAVVSLATVYREIESNRLRPTVSHEVAADVLPELPSFLGPEYEGVAP